MLDLEQAIRERAYHLWIADGCRDGNAAAHWLIAQREILASSLARFARVTISEDGAAKQKSKTPNRRPSALVRWRDRRLGPASDSGSKAESKCWMAGRPTLAAIGQVSPQASAFLKRSLVSSESGRGERSLAPTCSVPRRRE